MTRNWMPQTETNQLHHEEETKNIDNHTAEGAHIK